VLQIKIKQLILLILREDEGELQTFRLGDLVTSTPVTVGGPSEIYGDEFGDESYADFSAVFENRRQVTYVGANDGLLHAFNNGFVDLSENLIAFNEEGPNGEVAQPLGTELWAYAPFNLLPHLQFLTLPNYLHNFYVDGSAQSFDVKIFNDDPENCVTLNGDVLNESEIDEFLGCRYINGWGTILVAGMRQGGGDFPITDASGNALPDPDPEQENFITRSSYIIIDITNPELEPKVLAEVNHPDLNFTTSSFDVFYTCEGDFGNVCVNASGTPDSNPNDNFDGTWSLVFGSGPNDVRAFETDETAKVFSYDLDGESGVEVTAVSDEGEIAINSFVGGITARDWDNGELGFRNDDVAYFGTVQDTDEVNAATEEVTLGESGSLFRYFPNSIETPLGGGDRTNLLLDTDRPVFETPVTLSRETLGNGVTASWIYAGTGIFLARENADITEEELFVAVIESIDETEFANLADPITDLIGFDEGREDSELLTYETATLDDLQDVTPVQVLVAGTAADDGDPVADSQGNIAITGDFFDPLPLDPAAPAGGNATVDSVSELSEHIVNNTRGWSRFLPAPGGPSSRLTGAAVPFINALFFTTFQPESQTGAGICDGETGDSQLVVIDQTTGVASLFGALGVNASGVLNTASDPINGNLSAPLIFSSEALGTNDGVIIVQKDNGALTSPDENGGLSTVNDIEDLRSGWREIN